LIPYKIKKYTYNTKAFNFKEIFDLHIKKELGNIELNELNKAVDSSKDDISLDEKLNKTVTVQNDQDSWLYRKLYKVDPLYDFNNKNQVKGEFIKLYDKFVRMIAEEVAEESLVYQRKPTLRIHKPNNLSVGGFHRDTDYNHPKEEFNVWVPLTDAYETSTIWLEKDYKKENYFPFNSKFGEYGIFDGHLKHGNKLNQEGFSRVSFDFRIIRLSDFKEINKKSLTQNIDFSIGKYYSLSSL